MDYWKALKIIALNNVVNGSEDYELRRIFRWFSKTFNTPLHYVEELPIETVLQHYYENAYEELRSEDYREFEQEWSELIENEKERKERLQKAEAEKASEEEFLRISQEMAKKAAEKKSITLKGVGEQVPKIEEKVPDSGTLGKETLPAVPEIKMSFLSESDFSLLAEDLDKRGNRK